MATESKGIMRNTLQMEFIVGKYHIMEYGTDKNRPYSTYKLCEKMLKMFKGRDLRVVLDSKLSQEDHQHTDQCCILDYFP